MVHSNSFLYTLFKVGVIVNYLHKFMRRKHGESFISKGGYMPPLYICVYPNSWIIWSLLRLFSNIAKGEIMSLFWEFLHDLKVELRCNIVRWLVGEGSSYLLMLLSLKLNLLHLIDGPWRQINFLYFLVTETMFSNIVSMYLIQ